MHIEYTCGSKTTFCRLTGRDLMLFGWRASLVEWLAKRLHAQQERARIRFYKRRGIAP